MLYINLREKQDHVGFPARDTIPADMLTKFTDEEDYTKICHAFFTALFIGLGERISRGGDNFVQGWNDSMNQFGDPNDWCAKERHSFFAEVREHYEKVSLCHRVISSCL